MRMISIAHLTRILLLYLCDRWKNVSAILAVALITTSCGAEADRATPEAVVGLESFLSLERGTALERVRALLKMPGTHEFSALVGDTEYVCLHFLFQEPRVGFYLLFTSAHLKAIVRPPATKFERIPYKDGFREIPRPTDPEASLRDVLAANDLTRDEINQDIARAPRANRTPSNIVPAVLIATPFFIARSGKIESDYRTNEELVKKYDPFKIKVAADVSEVMKQFGAPYRIINPSAETVIHVYGSPTDLRINPQYRFSWVAVVFQNGKVVRVLSNHFFDRRLVNED
jgi:hypothetical protein